MGDPIFENLNVLESLFNALSEGFFCINEIELGLHIEIDINIDAMLG